MNRIVLIDKDMIWIIFINFKNSQNDEITC